LNWRTNFLLKHTMIVGSLDVPKGDASEEDPHTLGHHAI
jgi:hypothetical protein